MRSKDKAAFVTGAAGGIAKTIAAILARAAFRRPTGQHPTLDDHGVMDGSPPSGDRFKE